MVFVSEAIRAFGPRNCLLAGIFAMAAAAIAIGYASAPWQLYLADALLAFGWAGTSLGMITNTLGLWFDAKRGMAISLALNGASFGGIIGVPLLVAAIGAFGFSGALLASAIAMVVLMVPVILIFVGQPPRHGGNTVQVAATDAPSSTQIRARALRDIAFLTVSIAFALVLFAQVGFIVHLIAFLDPVIVAASGCRYRGGAVDGDGGGRPVAVLHGNRPPQPAAGVGDLVCQPGGRTRNYHQFA